MAPHTWPLFALLTMTSLQPASPQQFVFDNQLTSGAESPCLSRSGGYYADLASDCSSYTLCAPGGRAFDFACPPGTRFHQQFLVCDHQYRVDCSQSPRFFALNELIGRVTDGSELTDQRQQQTVVQPPKVLKSAAIRPQLDPRSLRPTSARAQLATAFSEPAPSRTRFSEPAPSRRRFRSQSQRSAAAPPTVPPPADVAQTLLELVKISTLASSRRPAVRQNAQRPGVAAEPRRQQVSPAVPSILTQVAALGRPVAQQLQEPAASGTFFAALPERPRQEPALGSGRRLQRLTKSLPSFRSTNEAARPRASTGRVRFPGRKVRPAAAPQSVAARRQGVRPATRGWTPVSPRTPDSDRRCPRCLAALVTDWDACFPCVSVLR